MIQVIIPEDLLHAVVKRFYDFKIFNQPCLTCYSSCQLHIGLYQPLNPVCESSNKYLNESSCELPPNTWKII